MKITITNTQTITIEDNGEDLLKKIIDQMPIEVQEALRKAAERNNIRRLLSEIFKR